MRATLRDSGRSALLRWRAPSITEGARFAARLPRQPEGWILQRVELRSRPGQRASADCLAVYWRAESHQDAGPAELAALGSLVPPEN